MVGAEEALAKDSCPARTFCMVSVHAQRRLTPTRAVRAALSKRPSKTKMIKPVALRLEVPDGSGKLARREFNQRALEESQLAVAADRFRRTCAAGPTPSMASKESSTALSEPSVPSSLHGEGSASLSRPAGYSSAVATSDAELRHRPPPLAVNGSAEMPVAVDSASTDRRYVVSCLTGCKLSRCQVRFTDPVD